MIGFLRVVAAVSIAIIAGKLLSKIKVPPVLGWLIAGMALGPYALGLLDTQIMSAPVYANTMHIIECFVGIMIGTELVWRKIKKLGKQIFVITLTQSFGTFLVVSGTFMLVFFLMDMPVFLGPVFGGIALATAPAPALSIVNEYKTAGPVTKTLIPMAALDDIIAIVVFLVVMAFTVGTQSSAGLPGYFILLIVVIPLGVGAGIGFLTGLLLRKKRKKMTQFLIVTAMIVVAAGCVILINQYWMPIPLLNYMMTGMALSATFSNMVSEEQLDEIMSVASPVLGVSFVVMILNLGAPLDYRLILGAGVFTAVYIVARAAGKIGGAAFGAHITHAPPTVKKYLGLTLLPHSGVSLVLTGIAASFLHVISPESALVVQGTIAAAAVINEIIAVILSKQAFRMAGEIGKAKLPSPKAEKAE